MARIGAGEGIRVEGLAELDRSLREFGSEFKGEMRKTNKAVAEFVTKDARAAAAGLGSTAAHVAPSLKASAGAQFAGVALGGGAYPMAAGAEFGGRGRPTTQQFQPHLGNTGYFLYPTIRRDLANNKIEAEYKRGIDKLIRKAGLG